MSENRLAMVNGHAKKTLEYQLDRLDRILDGFADALVEVVGDGVKATVGIAVHEAIQRELTGRTKAVAHSAGETVTLPINLADDPTQRQQITEVALKVVQAVTHGSNALAWKAVQPLRSHRSAIIVGLVAGVFAGVCLFHDAPILAAGSLGFGAGLLKGGGISTDLQSTIANQSADVVSG